MFWLSAILVCAALLCAYGLLWVRGHNSRRLLAGLPTLPSLPLIGNAHQILSGPENFIGVFMKMTQLIGDTLTPCVLWLGPTPVVVLTDPVHVKAVTNTSLEKPYLYKFAKPFVANGLVTASASIWKQSSKKLTGAFSSGVVVGYQEIFNGLAQKLVKEVRLEVGGAPFDLLPYLMKTTLESIYQITLGKSDMSDDVITPEYQEAFRRVMQLYTQRAMNPLLHWDPLYRLTSLSQEMKKYAAVVKGITNKVIAKRRREREELKTAGKSNIGHTKGKMKPYVDLLLELSETDQVFTEEQILAEMNTIIAAGHDTVANTLAMCFITIGKMPDVQHKLYEEMKEIFGDSKRPVTEDDLVLMTYCEAVINETLRLYPTVPVVLRNVDEDIPLDSCTIPAGSISFIFIWGSGRSTRLWGPDAAKFRPERWLQQDFSQDAVLLAFSYGRRACIGKKYAMSLMKTIVAHCVRELVFETEAKKLRLKVDVTLNVVEGNLVQVRERC